MGNFWLQVKIWTKTTLFGVAVLYGLIFIYNNSTETVRFWWWFGHMGEHTSLMFGVSAFVGGIIFAILVRTLWTTFRQVKTLQQRSRVERVERDITEMKEKASRLQTRPGGPPTTPAPGGAFEVVQPPADR